MDAQTDLIQPTEGEAKNGWTAATLTRFIRDREKWERERFYGAAFSYGSRPAGLRNRPTRADNRYSPFSW